MNWNDVRKEIGIIAEYYVERDDARQFVAIVTQAKTHYKFVDTALSHLGYRNRFNDSIGFICKVMSPHLDQKDAAFSIRHMAQITPFEFLNKFKAVLETTTFHTDAKIKLLYLAEYYIERKLIEEVLA